MIEENALGNFATIVSAARSSRQTLCTDDITTPFSEGGMSRHEFWRLRQNIHIAFIAGEVSEKVDIAAGRVLQILGDGQYSQLSCEEAWLPIVAHASSFTERHQSDYLAKRTAKVADVYRKLKFERHDMRVTTFGIEWTDAGRNKMVRQIDQHAKRMGGQNILKQLCAIHQDHNQVFDGMWLCGERSLGVDQDKEPSVPYGWLLSLAAKYMHQKESARRPYVTWRDLVSKVTDFAATFDCERYGQFEQINLEPAQISEVIQKNLAWHSFFRADQTHSLAPPAIEKAIKACALEQQEVDFQRVAEPLWSEYQRLQKHLEPDKILEIGVNIARREFPHLYAASLGKAGEVNKKFLYPTDGEDRNDSRFMFFELSKKKLLVRPLPFSNNAIIETIIRLLWSRVSRKNAKKFVGNIYETAIQAGLQESSQSPLCAEVYYVGKQRNEFDVALRERDEIMLFEVKGKSLTEQATSGDIIKFLDDISGSFMSSIEQLARHEIHLRNGKTPLNRNEDVDETLIIDKISVSPLSFGPVSDKLFLAALTKALTRAELSVRSDEATANKIVKNFNETTKKAIGSISAAIEAGANDADFDKFFLFFQWLDIGQVLYCLERSRQVIDAFKPIRHMTFQSRDFWTEISYAERQGLTAKYWN